jgi:hypothetical protein
MADVLDHASSEIASGSNSAWTPAKLWLKINHSLVEYPP